MASTQLGIYFTLALFSLKSPVSLFPSCLTFSLLDFLKRNRKPSRMGAGGVYSLVAISVKNNSSVTQSLSQAPCLSRLSSLDQCSCSSFTCKTTSGVTWKHLALLKFRANFTSKDLSKFDCCHFIVCFFVFLLLKCQSQKLHSPNQLIVFSMHPPLLVHQVGKQVSNEQNAMWTVYSRKWPSCHLTFFWNKKIKKRNPKRMAHMPRECTCARSLKDSVCYHDICCRVARGEHVEQGPGGLQTFAESFWGKRNASSSSLGKDSRESRCLQ